ncbi:MAG: ABC-2 transporter permease [Clostridia bacterium]|nr:ABC-2 transporter permease [Clostridia bacterium]
MKGLLYKDFYCLKQNMKYIFAILLLYGFIFIPQGNSSILGAVVIIFPMLVITTLSYDHAGKWDRFALTMPVTRKMLVRSKYILFLIMLLFGMLIGAVFSAAGLLFRQDFDIMEIMVEIMAVAVAALWFGIILLPLIYKFGVERARLFLLLLFALLGGGMMAFVSIAKNAPLPAFTPQQSALIIGIFLASSIAAYAVSYLVSVKIYQKKELS